MENNGLFKLVGYEFSGGWDSETEGGRSVNRATVKLKINDGISLKNSDGEDTMHALFLALKGALSRAYPQIERWSPTPKRTGYVSEGMATLVKSAQDFLWQNQT
jgi:hypothetical protein